VSEPADTSRVDTGAAPGHDANYILSQEEFHKSLAAWGNQLFGAQQVVSSNIRWEFREAEKTLGWVALSLAVWLAMAGYYAVKGQWRG
jgi:hypothetical protein